MSGFWKRLWNEIYQVTESEPFEEPQPRVHIEQESPGGMWRIRVEIPEVSSSTDYAEPWVSAWIEYRSKERFASREDAVSWLGSDPDALLDLGKGKRHAAEGSL